MKIPVNGVFQYIEKMLAEDWGYIWGTAGIKWTEKMQNATKNEMAQKYGKKWIGHIVTDCSGVMVYIWKQYGLTIPHGSNSIARQSVGKKSTLPQPGYAAFKVKDNSSSNWGDGKDYYHIGIVGRDGLTVYESQGTIMGFTTTSTARWDFFAPFKDVEYKERVMPEIKAGGKAEVIIKGGKLNVRNEPSTDGDVIGKLNNRDIVEVVAVYAEENFAYVKAEGITGYCSMTYLRNVDVDPKELKPEEPREFGILIPCVSIAAAEALAPFFCNAEIVERSGTEWRQ